LWQKERNFFELKTDTKFVNGDPRSKPMLEQKLEQKIVKLLEQISLQLKEIATTQVIIREEIGALKVEFELGANPPEKDLPVLMH